jgi:hypothetical protein
MFPQSDLTAEADEVLASLPEEYKTTEN